MTTFARRMHELVLAAHEMPHQTAITLGLTLLGSSEYREDFPGGFAWHELLEEGHGFRDPFQINVKIRARDAEQDAQLVLVQHRGIHHYTRLAVAQRQGHRHRSAAAGDAAHQVGARVLIEHRVDDLDAFDVAASPLRAEVSLHRQCAGPRAALDVAPRCADGPIRQQLLNQRWKGP
jgi:hypothetical protein